MRRKVVVKEFAVGGTHPDEDSQQRGDAVTRFDERMPRGRSSETPTSTGGGEAGRSVPWLPSP